jgi:hypothetical protein
MPIFSISQSIWSQGTVSREIRGDAFYAGYEKNGDVYVIRAYHEGHLIPGKVIPKVTGAHVAYNGAEHYKTHDPVEFLIGSKFAWRPMNASSVIPNEAVIGGHLYGSKVYIARVVHEGNTVVGHV